MKNTVIFDLDGTVLNTLDDLANAVNFALEGQNFPTHSAEKIKTFIGNGIRVLMKRSVPSGCPEGVFEECYKAFCDYYSLHLKDNTAPYSGILELLAELKAAGFKTAIVTNKADFAAQSLCKEMFGDLIDVTVGAGAEIRHKPCPDGTLKALEILGSEPQNAYFAGDSDVDFKTAENAGIDFIGVLWGFRTRADLERAGAVIFAENTDELKHILLQGTTALSSKT